MTREIEILLEKVEKELNNNDFRCLHKCAIDCYIDCVNTGRALADVYYIGGYCEIVDQRITKGKELVVLETWRRNGTARNKSITIEIREINGRTGTMVGKIKIYDDYTLKRIASAVKKIAEEYKK